MASLMENLMDIIEQEADLYGKLLELSKEKTTIIVANDIERLNQITEIEQRYVDAVANADKKREETMKDIANVMNKDLNTLTIPAIVDLLGQRPQEQQRLSIAADRLKENVANMARINAQNQQLISHALEMVEFDLNIVRGLKAAPQTAEYTKGAMSAGNQIMLPQGGFDAKQ